MDIKLVTAKISPLLLLVVSLLEKFGYTDIASLLTSAGSSIVAAVVALYAIYDYISKNFLHKSEPPAATDNILSNAPFSILKK